MQPKSRARAAAPIAAVAITSPAIAAAALAATAPTKGATYSGRPNPGHGLPAEEGTSISLVVSGSAKKVTMKMESFPLFCEGGGPPQISRFKAAAITGGKFKATGTETAEQRFGGGLTATATVTGRFSAGGKVKGSFEDKFAKSPSCGRRTSYTAAVAP